MDSNLFRRETPDEGSVPAEGKHPTSSELRRWRQYLADEQAEAAVYRDLAGRRTGEEREILFALADAEGRHEKHWRTLLGDQIGKPRRAALRTRILGFLARHFGSVFVLALAQRAEDRSTYDTEVDATAAMAADEHMHAEVVRALATRGRNRLSGTFRAAVFGANDGLVSNLSLVLGISASGVSNHTVLVTGMAGLLAGALSMGAGEYVSVNSQRELLQASTPDAQAGSALPQLDVDANELALVYRARGVELLRALPRRGTQHRGARRGRQWARCRGVQFLLLRLGRPGAGAAVPVRAPRPDRRDRRSGAGGRCVAVDRCRRRFVVRWAAAKAGAASIAHRLRRRRRHLSPGTAVRRWHGLTAGWRISGLVGPRE
jgi:hypothetical protein